MRTKALLLAACPPVEGPWVPIGECDAWDVKVQTRGKGEVELSILVSNSERGHVVVSPDGPIRGRKAKALLEKADGVDSVTVFLEERGKDADA